MNTRCNRSSDRSRDDCHVYSGHVFGGTTYSSIDNTETCN